MTSTTVNTIKVWVKIENNEPEKVEVRSDYDIDDLKSELFLTNKEEKRKHYCVYNNVKLSSSAHVPHGTTADNPILVLKIDDNNDNITDEDTVRTVTSNLSTVPNKEEFTIDSTMISEASSNVNEKSLPTTLFTVTTSIPTAIVTTTTPTVDHGPLHLVKTIHHENGDKYVGEINEKQQPNGTGTMYWKNGRRYEGLWENGKKNGHGVEYGANGAINFVGEWKDDVFVTSYNDDSDKD